MLFPVCLIFFFIAPVAFSVVVHQESSDMAWGYPLWTDPECSSTNKRPSPISLNTNQARVFTFPNEAKPSCGFTAVFPSLAGQKMTVHNDGKTVKVKFTESEKQQVRVSIPPILSHFSHLNFHFGRSEHKINGEYSEGEIEMVFYAYHHGSYEEAILHQDGIVILSTLLKSDSDQDDDEMFKKIKELAKPRNSQDYTIEATSNITLWHFIPTTNKDMFRYAGSLSEPPCNAVVTRYVFKEPLVISSFVLNHFMNVKRSGGENIANYREIQSTQETVHHCS